MNLFTTDHPMASKPSGGMKDSTVAFTTIAILLFITAGFVWQRALRKERLRKPVFERPVRFEEGYSFTNSFTVSYAGAYWVEVVCPRTNLSPHLDQIGANFFDPLPIKFKISNDGQTVAEGDSAVRDGSSSAKEFTRRAAIFSAERGKNYYLTFRVLGAFPTLETNNTFLRIRRPLDKNRDFVDFFLISPSHARLLALVGLLCSISPASYFVGRLIWNRSRKVSSAIT